MRCLLPLLLVLPAPVFALGQLLPTPPDSQRFGSDVGFLPNGNFVITDPDWSGIAERVGAVYLYAPDGTLISRLSGSTHDDAVGSGGVVVLANGNFLVPSPDWDAPGGITDAGAVTFGDGDLGFGQAEAQVSAANSLLGTQANDIVGSLGVQKLTNGHYVVASPEWDNGNLADAGAVTWGDGENGTVGGVGAANSLVGTHIGDHVGAVVTPLANGNFVVGSPLWDNDLKIDVGAATLRTGTSADPAALSAANSLIGASAGDQIGSGGFVALANGHAAFASPAWDNGIIVDAGAVTCIDGDTALPGVVGTGNSFVGSTNLDKIGSGGLIALANSGFAFASPSWDHGPIVDAGAVSRGGDMPGNGNVVGAGNSMVGGSANDRVGSGGVTALPNGNFVAVSPEWDDGGKPDVGAVRWMRGDGGTVGTLNRDTALRGNFAGDLAFARVTALVNGNYVVAANFAQNGPTLQAGAATWCPGDKICSKVIGTSRSLMGARDGDGIGTAGVFALSDGNYVVASPFVDSAQHTDSGAVTWGDGTAGSVGEVDATNSLVGRANDDQVGAFGVFALADGRYLALSPFWDGLDTDAGAITLAPAGQPFTGVVEEGNSLTGAAANDNLGWHLGARDTGDDRVVFAFWRTTNAGFPFAGAVAVVDTATPPVGAIDLEASAIRGVVPPHGGSQMRFDYHEASQSLVVGDPLANYVWLASLATAPLPGPIFHDGFED